MTTAAKSADNLHMKLARAVQDIAPVHKEKEAAVGKFTYRYTDIVDVLRAVKTAFGMHGLSLLQPVDVSDGLFRVNALVIDQATGESLLLEGPGMKLSGEPQAVGSALSYCRRYSLTTLFALEVEDDDGGKAQRAATQPDGRTPAERQVRQAITKMPPDERKDFMADFRSHFGCSLTDLPEHRHGDALQFYKEWTTTGWTDDTKGADEPDV